MKKYLLFVALLPLLLASCGKLSKEAKGMIGDYYISEVSIDTPVLQLKEDGTCVRTAIRPNYVTFSVEGKWNVKNDSLIIDLDPNRITWEGDRSMIGDFPTHTAYYISAFNGLNLEVVSDGLTYSLHRRVKTND
ncbi:MAG: hypothetical protein J1E63_04130 [Muribaculaceae bacterium]|nr:hypothetical protein [Muribaculaceae bacterium]